MEVVKAFALLMSLWIIQGAAAQQLVSIQAQQPARSLQTTSYSNVKVVYSRCPRVTCKYDPKKQAYTNCEWQSPPMICCGGSTGVRCPALACSYAFTLAISAPGGCAQAEAQVSALSVNPTNYNAVSAELKKVFTFFAVDKQKTQAKFFDVLEVVTKIVTEAVSLSCVKGFEYVCIKPLDKCGYNCPVSTCRNRITPSKASSIIYGLAQSVSRAIAQSVAVAWYEVFSGHPDCLEFAGESYAIGQSVADATNVAIAKMNKKYLATDRNTKCDKENVKTEFAQAFSLAFVCDVAKATILYFGDNGEFFSHPEKDGTASSSTNLALVSCMSSVSAAFSESWYYNTQGKREAYKTCKKRCTCKKGQVAVTGKNGKDFCIPYGLVTTTKKDDIKPGSDCFDSVDSTVVPVCGKGTVTGDKTIHLPSQTTSVQLQCKTTNPSKTLTVKVSGTVPGDDGPESFTNKEIGKTTNGSKFFGAYYSGPNGYLTSVKLSSSGDYCCEFIKSSCCTVDFPPKGACGGNDCH